MSRSYLYVPGDREDRLARAAQRGADALILDLEDAVAPAAKASARQTVSAFLSEAPPAAEYWIRVNNDDSLRADITAVAELPIAGVCLPKASVDSVDEAFTLLTEASGRPVPIAGLVETAAGVAEVEAIARCEGLSHLAIGEADLAADLGVDAEFAEAAMTPLRMKLVVASAAAGLKPPTGPVSTQWSDLDELRSTTTYLAGLGFGSRAAIHPAQVEVINAVFTPTAAELDAAEALVAGYEAALAGGAGVFVASDGSMVDEAVVRNARRVIDNAKKGVPDA